MHSSISWLPNDELIEKVYYCTKHPEICFYRSKYSHHVKDHMETCSVETNVKSVQHSYGDIKTHISSLVKDKILPETLLDFKVTDLVCFDIETVNRDDEGESDLRPISIAVASTLEDTKYFERSTSSPEDGLKLVADFLDYLDHLQSVYLAR